VEATIASPNTFSPSPAHGGRRGRGMRVACLVAANRWHPWNKTQGRPERGILRRSYLFNARFPDVRRAKSSKGKDLENREIEKSRATRLYPPLHRVPLTRDTLACCSQQAGPTPSGQAHRPSPLWRTVVVGVGVILWVVEQNHLTETK
jgi:hypothetical protein